MHIYVRTSIYTYMYIQIYICRYVYKYIHQYAHTYTRTDWNILQLTSKRLGPLGKMRAPVETFGTIVPLLCVRGIWGRFSIGLLWCREVSATSGTDVLLIVVDFPDELITKYTSSWIGDAYKIYSVYYINDAILLYEHFAFNRIREWN